MVDYMKLIKRILLILGIVILIIFITTINLKEIFNAIKQIEPLTILILIFITLCNILVKAWRWQLLTRKIARVKISTSFSFCSIIAGVAAGSFIPGRVELAKPFLLKTEHQVPLSKSLSSLIIERILDLTALLLILASSLFFISQKIISINLIAILIALIIAFTIVIVSFPKLFLNPLSKIIKRIPLKEQYKERLTKFVEHMLLSFAILKSKSSVFLFFILSFVANSLEVLRFYLLLQYLGVPASMALVGFVFTTSIILGIISTIPGGIGITEISASAILISMISITPASIIKSAVLIERIISYYSLILIGAVILIFQNKFFKNGKAEEH